jgi:hypothetical protein
VSSALRLCAALVLGAAALGCAGVKPWERDLLARRDMAFEPDAREATARGHIFFSKEASLEGGGAGGGGCGCN